MTTFWTGTLRAATVDDLADIARLMAAGWAAAYREILPPDALAAQADVERRAAVVHADWEQGRRFLVAADASGRIVGTVNDHCPARLAGFDAEIDGFYVHPEAAGGGIGRALAGAMAREFLARRFSSLAVHTFEKNSGGRGFYEKLGGRLHSADFWEGYRCVWYVWDETAMARIA